MRSNSPRIDPRVLRTRHLIKDAFVKLLVETDVEKMSVNRIAELATINRVTFYLHYRDIPDLLDKLADEMVEEIRLILDQESADDSESKNDADWSLLENLLEHIADHADFYKLVLARKQIPIFTDRLLKLLTDVITNKLKKMESESFLVAADVPLDITVWYVSSAVIGTIIAWLRNDMPYTPSFLARQFSALSLGKS